MSGSGVYVAQNIFYGKSGLVEDRYINTWHFSGPTTGVGSAQFDNIRDMLKDFYTKKNGVWSELCKKLSLGIQTFADVVIYDLGQPKPRVPLYSGRYSGFQTGQSIAMPHEVALCFSFEAARVSGAVQSRRRNRVYIGPFNYDVADNAGRPTLELQTMIYDSGMALKAAADASLDWEWSVWSPTNEEDYEVSHIWVDNAFDTQRRRGLAPTTRLQHTF
jgi:hypothetical protein